MQSNFDMVFLGGLFPKEMENEIYLNSKGPIQNAANAFQWELVKGFDSHLATPIKIINSLYIGSFPKRYKRLLVKTSKFSHTNNIQDINVGFINLIGIKNIFRYLSLKKYLKSWAQDNKPQKVIVAYALTDTFVRALKYVKKLNPEITTCIVVPDLPEYMNTSTQIDVFYKLLKRLEILSINKNMGYIDNFILLTKHMKDRLNVKKYIVIEGIATDIFGSVEKTNDPDNKKTILYTGTLNERYGILNLVEAFKQIKDNSYLLIICGDGDAKQKIIAEAREDSRIIYKGLKRREEVLRLQKNATVLVNPRQNTEEYTKYSFPSKILEYLSSGTPVIAYKLDGMPDEYDEHIFYISNNSISALKNKMIEVCEKSASELYEHGRKAKDFVLKEKNGTVQIHKILEILKKQ